MLIKEIMESNSDIDQKIKITAIAQLIADRTKDANSKSKIKTDTFIKLLNNMGIPVDTESLMDLVQTGELKQVISDVNQDDVSFKGQHEIDPTEMTVDKAQSIVKDMAKRNMHDKGKLGSPPPDNGIKDLPEYN